jgi:hypothetical protein
VTRAGRVVWECARQSRRSPRPGAAIAQKGRKSTRAGHRVKRTVWFDVLLCWRLKGPVETSAPDCPTGTDFRAAVDFVSLSELIDATIAADGSSKLVLTAIAAFERRG